MSVNHRLVNPLTDQLFDGILTLKTREECYEFFEDLCTINELRDMSQRLEVARMLEAGDKYDRIEEATGASTATICRGEGAGTGWICAHSRAGDRSDEPDDILLRLTLRG